MSKLMCWDMAWPNMGWGCDQYSESENGLQRGRPPLPNYKSAKASASLTQYPFSRVHMATWHHQSEEISVFTGIFRWHRKSSSMKACCKDQSNTVALNCTLLGLDYLFYKDETSIKYNHHFNIRPNYHLAILQDNLPSSIGSTQIYSSVLFCQIIFCQKT